MQTDQIRSAPVLTKVASWSIVMRTNMKRTTGCCYQSLRPKTDLTRLTLTLVHSLPILTVNINGNGNHGDIWNSTIIHIYGSYINTYFLLKVSVLEFSDLGNMLSNGHQYGNMLYKGHQCPIWQHAFSPKWTNRFLRGNKMMWNRV